MIISKLPDPTYMSGIFDKSMPGDAGDNDDNKMDGRLLDYNSVGCKPNEYKKENQLQTISKIYWIILTYMYIILWSKPALKMLNQQFTNYVYI